MELKNKYIVTTTISEPTFATQKFAEIAKILQKQARGF